MVAVRGRRNLDKISDHRFPRSPVVLMMLMLMVLMVLMVLTRRPGACVLMMISVTW